jgi:uncharacterized protein (DUF1330 family)
MSAYALSDVEFLDRDLVAQYRALAQASITKYGGRYLVRGGAIEPVEGDWRPPNIVVVEFPSLDRAREWYRSPEYAPALDLRERALKRRLIFVEGLAE